MATRVPLPGVMPPEPGEELLSETLEEYPDKNIVRGAKGVEVYGEDRGRKYGSQHFHRFHRAQQDEES